MQDQDSGNPPVQEETPRSAERIVSAISRRLALAQSAAIDAEITAALAEVTQQLGADGALLARTMPDDSIAYTHAWFDPALGPVTRGTPRRGEPYSWLRAVLRTRGPQVFAPAELGNEPSPDRARVRYIGIIPTYAGDLIVGALCFYYRDPNIEPSSTDLAPFEILTDVLFGAVTRRDAENALRESEARYRMIVETAIEGIWTVTADWRISFMNRRMGEILGRRVDEMIGTSVIDLVPEERRERARASMAQRERGIADVFDAQYLHSDGTPREVRVAAAPYLDANGAFSGALAMVQDITEEKRLQAELATARELEAVGRLAGGVAHDINNVLTVILAHASSGAKMTTGELAAAFAEISSAAQHGSEISRQLLAFARRVPSQPRALDACKLVEALLPTLRKLVGEHIAVTFEHAVAWPVIADALQLERVLINLAANARDAMPDGGRLAITLREHVEPRSGRTDAGDYVAIAVRDTGHGMAPEVVARLFEPFFTTKGERGGTGLGLASAYGVMQQLGGAIYAESRVGAGTTITVLVPRSLHPPAADNVPVRTPPEAKQGVTILFVEDLPPLRAVVSKILTGNGYRVIVAEDGEQATQVTDDIDLLVTDVVLPRAHGYRVAEMLRGRIPTLRVLYMSGYDRSQGLEEALRAPGTAFLMKPFAPDVLLAAIAEVLARPTGGDVRANTPR
ncbi:MAG: PAS domain S-box protein [Kofleriaceae bacterium]|nr:PAS domain S-box protein [Kofleriaceae bacterium]